MPIALVTEITHFVGLPAAAALADDGVTIAAHDASFTDNAAREAFEVAHPGFRALTAQEPEALAAECIDKLSGLDIVISNDAYPAKKDPVIGADPAHMTEALDALVTRPFRLAGAAAAHMADNGGGKIIFVSSAAPLRGLANYSIYATARGATNAMVKTLSLELAKHGINVNALAPNYVESPTYFPKELTENPETLARMTKNIPLGRLGQPAEAGAAIAFLASDKSGFITGHVLPFAGGWA
ncbi:MAG: SDR family oxidoreductase [Alphaproteobacteria bacterium]